MPPMPPIYKKAGKMGINLGAKLKKKCPQKCPQT